MRDIIPNFLKSVRKKNGVKQNVIADFLGHPNTTIVSKMESGRLRPSIELVVLYMMLFDCEVKDLFPLHYGQVKEKIERHFVTNKDCLKSSSSRDGPAPDQRELPIF